MKTKYGVKDVFVTLQGEGMRAGTKAVFVRFTGCNLWNGLETHRSKGLGACAKWCDTDFAKGISRTADSLIEEMDRLWEFKSGEERWCVLTGGEPCLQVDRDLLIALQDSAWKVAVETNGTVFNDAVRDLADHICIAPKLDAQGKPTQLQLGRANEVKVVLPGTAHEGQGWTTEMLDELTAEFQGKTRFYVQPQDPLISGLVGDTVLVRRDGRPPGFVRKLRENIERCVSHVMQRPRWTLSYQTHKALDLP